MAPTRKTAPKQTLSLELKFDRSTKGTHVFTSEEENAPIPTLYIRKSGFENGTVPETVTVTIEAG